MDRIGTASPLPGDPTATSHADGSFELDHVPSGPLALQIRADGYYITSQSGIMVSDGAAIGPVVIELIPLPSGQRFGTESVGIGLNFMPDGDSLRVVAARAPACG